MASGEEADAGGLVGYIAQQLGSTDYGIRLLLSLFAGYPLAALHRYTLYGKSHHLQHIYIITCGLALCYFNYGIHTIHSLLNIALIYGLIQVLGGTVLSVGLAFAINMLYLCIGYYTTMTDEYMVSWTTSHCILTLRLTGIVMDIYDGRKKQDQLTKDQQLTALEKSPSLLEIASHCYFFGGFLIGPQFSMRRYQDFISGAFSDKLNGGKPACVKPALLRLATGLFYILIFQVGVLYFPDSYLYSASFKELSFLWKCIVIMIWAKITVSKYVACWLITEGICILAGLTYNGRDEHGHIMWDGCTSMDLHKYELFSSGHEAVESFNINTNLWMASYVFKRLRFLGNKQLSQSITMFFLAIWHGLYSGYFMNFFLEFLVINFEKEVKPYFKRSELIQRALRTPWLRLPIWFVMKCHIHFVISYALVSFCLFTYDKWGMVYYQLYFVVHVGLFSWPLFNMVLRSLSRGAKRKGNENGEISSSKTD